MNANLLWIIAVVVAVIGVIVLISGSVIWGIILLILAALIGPGRIQHLQPTPLTRRRSRPSADDRPLRVRLGGCSRVLRQAGGINTLSMRNTVALAVGTSPHSTAAAPPLTTSVSLT